MPAYWISFRIADDDGYDERYDALNGMAKQLASGKYWEQTSSFIMFDSDSSIDTIAVNLKGQIDPAEDLFVIRAMDTKSAWICGSNPDPDIFELMPYLKQL